MDQVHATTEHSKRLSFEERVVIQTCYCNLRDK